MKYNTEVVINLPIAKVIELFDNSDNMKKWQPELVSYEHLSGTPGEVGAKAKLNYKMNKREVEMIETITERDLPKKFSGTYEANGVMNYISNTFEEIEPGKTKWVAENEFQFKGFMKLMGMLMPGAFKKQSQKYLDQFKAFAEAEV
ncbi:MAG: SRPBCC family protein [Ignavibacteriae bacterium]|nr:SRPBCC family protein [Ignavibacteriota bacterium]NOG98303.1 SRPBCC family protein [Ignavibacteriota bacterium]